MKKIISIFLSLLVLISSIGITFSTHFCMGHAVDSEIAIGMHELSCGMMDMDASCDGFTEPELMAPDCCNNEFLSLDIEDEYQMTTEKISVESSFLFTFTYTFLFDLQNNATPQVVFSDTHPPPLEHDYQSMYQSFLL